MKTYLTDWKTNQQELNADMIRVEALEPVWDLSQGWHPDIESDNSLYDPMIRRPLQLKKVDGMPRLVAMAPEGVVTGHVMMKDSNTISLIQPDQNAPILPLFARDLAGRIIYIGTTRHKQKTKEHKSHLMPFGSMHFDESKVGFNLLERTFFCPFRMVEMSTKLQGSVSGSEGLAAAVTYFAPNLYPYKLRLDTFYQDGWRIPQTERLFVTPVNEKVTADRASSELLKLWKGKPEDQTYEEFVEANEQFMEDIFQRGCTLIPTIEAYNGVNKVDDDFNHVGFWSGRAVVGLHEIVSQEESDAPQGTILKVLEPGFITAKDISPARVVVSDGMKFKSSETERFATARPKRSYPDLRLPHQRTTSKWGAIWVPTHPADFEEPVMWDWEDESSGRFVQTRGPIWDPLHYYYACTPKILDSFKRLRLRRNINLVKVPDDMLTKFHPVVEFRGFDSFNVGKKKLEIQSASLIPTSIFHQSDESCVCDVGYHPLPISFEFELDNWWFPDMAPKNRVTDIIPLNVESRLVGVIRPNIPADRFLAAVEGDIMAPWVTDPLAMSSLRADDLENYPYLNRYLKPNVTEEDMTSLVLPYLAEHDEDDYPINQLPTNLVRLMEENWPGLYQIFLGFSRRAMQVDSFRHEMFQKNFMGYIHALWEMTPIDEMFSQADEVRDPKKNLPTSAVSGSAEF